MENVEVKDFNYDFVEEEREDLLLELLLEEYEKDFNYDFNEEEREELLFEEYETIMMNCHILKNN